MGPGYCRLLSNLSSFPSLRTCLCSPPPQLQVLLEVHNTHHYLRFFAEVRKAVAAGRFAAYRDWFLRRRQRWLVGEGSGQ